VGFVDGSLVVLHATQPETPIYTIFNGTGTSATTICSGLSKLVIGDSSRGWTHLWETIFDSSEHPYFYISDDSRIVVGTNLNPNLRIYGVETECIGQGTLPPTTSTTQFYQSICDSAIIKPGECMVADQFKYSCNGCFRMGIINGNLVFSSTLDAPTAARYVLDQQNNAAKLCAIGSELVFLNGSDHRISKIISPSSNVPGAFAYGYIDEYSRLMALVSAPSNLNLNVEVYGRYSQCYEPTIPPSKLNICIRHHSKLITFLAPPPPPGFSINVCDSALIRPGQCLYPGEQKYSCSYCFRMALFNGNLAVSWGISNVWDDIWTSHVFTQGRAVRGCSEDSKFVFYSDSNEALWTINIDGFGKGYLYITEDSQVVFSAEGAHNPVIVGISNYCYNNGQTTDGKLS
jgi:hypothetical protein